MLLVEKKREENFEYIGVAWVMENTARVCIIVFDQLVYRVRQQTQGCHAERLALSGGSGKRR